MWDEDGQGERVEGRACQERVNRKETFGENGGGRKLKESWSHVSAPLVYIQSRPGGHRW